LDKNRLERSIKNKPQANQMSSMVKKKGGGPPKGRPRSDKKERLLRTKCYCLPQQTKTGKDYDGRRENGVI